MITRRQMLQSGAAGLGACAVAGLCAASLGAVGLGAAGSDRLPRPQGLVLRHLLTGERLLVEVDGNGGPPAASMAGIEYLLRDPSTDQRGSIDPQLIRQLLEVAAGWTPLPVYDVLDAYRSSARRARASLHHQGRAIDLRLSGIASADLAASAAARGRGGVGYYRSADFVHLDTGAPRCWQG